MSTPANEPQDPQNPMPEQPRYGQNAPQYGQNPAQAPNPYGQPAQTYGQNPTPPPYGQSPYGQAPQQYPGSFPVPQQFPMGDKPVVSTRPGVLTAAFWLLIVSGAFTLLGSLIVLLVPRGELMKQFEAALAADPTLQQQMEAAGLKLTDLAPFLDMTIIVIVIFGVISAGLYALIAFMLRAGSNGARITGTILAAISLLGLSGLFTIPVILFGVVAMVLAWLRPSSDYIAYKKASRAVR